MSLSFVGLGKNKNTRSGGGQAMCIQHSTEKEATHEQGIVVPLELEGLRILKQEVQADGRIRVEVMGTNERASCPHCSCVCVKPTFRSLKNAFSDINYCIYYMFFRSLKRRINTTIEWHFVKAHSIV